jgi:hypothetical protein
MERSAAGSTERHTERDTERDTERHAERRVERRENRGGDRDRSRRWWAEPRLLLVLALAANVAVAVAARHFPYEDVPNHITRYVMMDRAWFGTAPSYVEAHLAPGAYIGIDLVGVLLVHFFGPELTARIFGVLVVVAIPLGLWTLLRAVGTGTAGTESEERERHGLAVGGWALAAVPIGLGFFSLVSFMNYVLGVASLFVWMAIWWPARANASPARLVVLFLGGAWLFLVHLSAPLMMLVVVWTDWLLAGAGHRRARVPVVVVMSACVALMVAWTWAVLPPAPTDITDSTGIVFKSVGVKLRNVLTPFFAFTYPEMAVTLGGYLVGVWFFLRENGRNQRWNTLLWSSLAFAGLYAIFPANTPGTGYLDARWLLPMFLLPFAAVVGGGRPPTAVASWVLVACAWLNAAVTWQVTRPIDRELDDYATVLDQIPPGHHLLPIVADDRRHGLRIFPYRHFAFWYMIERGGRVPVLFNYAGDGGGAPRQSFMSHFIEIGHLYTLSPSWGTTEFTPLDWMRVNHDYDYIVVAGRDPRVLDQVTPHARQVTRVGDITLFQTDPALVAAGPGISSGSPGSGGPVAEPSRGSTATHAGERPIP